MAALLDVILSVFLVIGFGYVVVWRGLFEQVYVDGVMKFAQGFAIPLLLFRAISQLDLVESFDPTVWASFYLGAISGFLTGLIGARYIFGRGWEDAVAIGFVGLFSNSLLLGVPITERAFGPEALETNFAIIAIHSPFCYAVGITAMEIVKNRGGAISHLPGKVLKAMFKNAMIIGILCGAVVNVLNIPQPGAFVAGVDLIVRAALPAALFGLGGVLYRYKPEGDMATIAFIVFVSLIVHPVISYGLGTYSELSTEQMRSLILTAAMAPGVNAFLFANMYGNATRVAASAVLMGTFVSIFTVWVWLAILA